MQAQAGICDVVHFTCIAVVCIWHRLPWLHQACCGAAHARLVSCMQDKLLYHNTGLMTQHGLAPSATLCRSPCSTKRLFRVRF